MKKNIFVIITLTLFLGLLGFFVYLSFQKDDYSFKITAVEKSNNYLITSEDVAKNRDLIEMFIYTTKKNISLTNVEKITNAYLESDELTIALKVEKIIDMNFKQVFYDDIFYMFSYILRIDGINNDEYVIDMDKAYLTLHTSSYNVKLLIGSFYYEKIEEIGSSILSISKIKPVVNKINNNKTLMAIDIELSNFSSGDINIIDIKLLDSAVRLSQKESMIVTTNINSNDDISKILGYYYDYQDKGEEDNLSIILSKKTKVELLIPLKYKTDYPIYGCGIKIKYEYLGKEYDLYFDDYNFFIDNTFFIDENKIRIQTYEDY